MTSVQEMFLNADSLPLGVRQDKVPVNDVILPPWAKGSPVVMLAYLTLYQDVSGVSSNVFT